ncbi:MAG: HAD family hydrolase [Promethearchaeota archaeon]|jgi:phosphoglycolate phosphatase-like HAD superfamily hydrolase
MNSKKPIKAIVWDLDGTIIHFKIDSIKARMAAINILKSHGIDNKKLSIQKSILDNINISKVIFQQSNSDPNKVNKILQEVDNGVSKIEYEAALNATVIKGIEDVLNFAAKNNLRQAIFTFNKYEHAKLSLDKVRLLKFFDVIIGRDNINNPKPHPDHLLFICNKLGVNTNEILVIGDNYRDIEAAINVGAHSIAVHTKLAIIETLQKADVIVEESEIPQKLIEEIKKLLYRNKKKYKISI